MSLTHTGVITAAGKKLGRKLYAERASLTGDRFKELLVGVKGEWSSDDRQAIGKASLVVLKHAGRDAYNRTIFQLVVEQFMP